MRMSDVMSSLGLAIYPIAGMFLFLSVFIGVILQVTARRSRGVLDGAALLPLADETSPGPRSPLHSADRPRETKP